MVGLGPKFGQHGRVEVRAVGDYGLGLQPPVLEVLEEPSHVILIVGTDQREGHRQITDRVGGQQEGILAQVQFIHAEGAAEVLQDHAAMLGQIELSSPVAKLVVDEPRGEFQQELTAQRLQSLFDVHAVLDDAIQDQIADLVVVEGPGEDALGGVAEGCATIALGLILAAGDLQIGDGLIDDGADLARR